MARLIRYIKRNERASACWFAAIFYFILTDTLKNLTHVGEQGSTQLSSRGVCRAPTVSIAVLTVNRTRSLKRLLSSLQRARYGCAKAHLSVYIDVPRGTQRHEHGVVRLTNQFRWSHGRKRVVLHPHSVGLAGNWFSVETYDTDDYLLILEDDMEVSSYFHKLLSHIHVQKTIHHQSITSFCLHPGDWELGIDINCSASTASSVLYESPEPCNWAPIWKVTAWREYTGWVAGMKKRAQVPYVPESVAYNYNMYLSKSYDVQSPWVWRFNWEHAKRSVRYSFLKCAKLRYEPHFAINHKEPGEHFKKKKKENQRLVSWERSFHQIEKLMFSTKRAAHSVARPQRFIQERLTRLASLIPPP